MDGGAEDKAAISVEAAFKALTEYVDRFDPLKLLSQLSLTHLSVPDDKFIGEGHDVNRWMVWIEFLAGRLVTHEFPVECETNATGQTMERIEELLDIYFTALTRGSISEASDSTVSKADKVLGSIRSYALWVRGTAYQHQYYEMARGIYGPHDSWFRATLGFTIDEVITAADALFEEYALRMNSGREQTLQRAEKLAEERGLTGDEKEQETIALACYLYFGQSDDVLSFTSQELSAFSGVSQQACDQILKRLSQEFGYRNSLFPNTFSDPHSAPWDYNTLYERPFIQRGDRYWMLLSPIMQTVILTTFYFDLMQDAAYRPTFEEARGRWLEANTAEYLRRVFADKDVLLNPLYPDGNELSDVLVLHDRKLLIVQCKSKGLTFQARMGASSAQLKADLEKAVKNAFTQGARARQYLLETPLPTLRFSGSKHEIRIDHDQVNGVHIINVTAAPLQNVTTRWASVNPHLELFKEGDYPWSLSLADLDVLTEILPTPADFLHFATRRLAMEHLHHEMLGDELDLLGFYLKQGLYFELDEFKEVDLVCLVGMSQTIDEYMFRKYVLADEAAAKPAPPMPPGFEDFVSGVEALRAPYGIDVAMILLDYGYKDRQRFVEQAQTAIQQSQRSQQPRAFSLGISGKRRGFSFLVMDAGGDQEKLFRRLGSLALLRKHQQKYVEWAGLGCDLSTGKTVDVIFYAAFDPHDDAVLDEMVATHLGKGKKSVLDQGD